MSFKLKLFQFTTKAISRGFKEKVNEFSTIQLNAVHFSSVLPFQLNQAPGGLKDGEA